MKIVLDTSAAVDAELAKLAELQGKGRETLGPELASRNLLENLRAEVRAARKAALRRVLIPVQEESAAQTAYVPIDWAAADRPAPPLYPPIEWPAPKGSAGT